MHLATIAAALLLPLLAVADDPLTTTTATMTSTQTLTVTLRRAHTVTETYGNYTSSYMPTAATTSKFATTTASASASVSPISKNAGSSLGAAHAAVIGVAGLAMVVLL